MHWRILVAAFLGSAIVGAIGWVKLHLMVGTVTHVVTGVKVSSEADCPVLPETLAQTLVYHRVQEVSADKAYLANYNLAAIVDDGALPYIPFKTNSLGMASKSEHWRRMWCLFQLKAEAFHRSYHRRSNVESTIGSIKARCGGGVRNKLPVAQCNEVLAKVLLHNLACVVHAIEKYGIDVSFPSIEAAAVTP
jgi:transposase